MNAYTQTIQAGTAPETRTALTLADAMSLVPTLKSTRSVHRRKDICSSLATIAKIIGKPPEQIALDPQALSAALTTEAPRAYGVGTKRYRNLLSDLRGVLIALGISPRHGTDVPETGAWASIMKAADSDYGRFGLLRFIRFCDTKRIGPTEVDEKVLEDFAEHQKNTEIVRNLNDRIYRTSRVWNSLCDRLPELGLKRLSLRRKTNQYILQDAAFVPSFIDDLNLWCRGRARTDVAGIFDDLAQEDPSKQQQQRAKQMKASSIALRRSQLLAAASAMVHRGRDPSTIASLRDLVEPFDTVRGIAQFHYDRRATTATQSVFGILEVLRQVAKYHVRISEERISQIAMIRDRVRPKGSGIAPRNRERLRPLEDDRVRAALLHLPAELMRQADKEKKLPRRARLATCAVAIEILLICPLRIGDLIGLRLDVHFRRSVHGRREFTAIVISADETKNGSAIDWPIPSSSAALIEKWISKYRAEVAPADSAWFFPGAAKGARSISGMRNALEEEIARCTGLQIHPHLMRHFAATLFLRHNPGRYESVRRVLGHKSLKTTIDSYMPAEADAAARQFDDVVMKERETTKLLARHALGGSRAHRQQTPGPARVDAAAKVGRGQ
jgi:integrase